MFHPSLILEEKRIILALKLFQIKNNLVTILRERSNSKFIIKFKTH